MKRTLYIKFLLSYLIYGVLAFVVLFTFAQHSIVTFLELREAQQLYRESALIASRYAEGYTNSTLSLEDFQGQMEALGTYLDADIWVVDNQKRVLFDSSGSEVGKKAQNAEYKILTDFDTADFGSRYYMIGDFYSIYSDDVLTVFSPVTSNYRVQSYVLIHKPVSRITGSMVNGFMNIAFFTIAIVFLCAFVILLFFTHTVYRPLHKITTVAQT